MKFFTRGLVLIILSLGMLVVVGCGTDNEAEAEKLAKAAGDPGKANPKAIPSSTPPPPATEADRGKQLQDNLSTQGYPGAREE